MRKTSDVEKKKASRFLLKSRPGQSPSRFPAISKEIACFSDSSSGIFCRFGKKTIGHDFAAGKSYRIVAKNNLSRDSVPSGMESSSK
jgi:hypothetical protein